MSSTSGRTTARHRAEQRPMDITTRYLIAACLAVLAVGFMAVFSLLFDTLWAVLLSITVGGILMAAAAIIGLETRRRR